MNPLETPLGPHDAVLFDMDGTLLFLPVDIDALRTQLEAFHRRYGLEMSFRPLTDDLANAARKLTEKLGAAEARAAIRWAQSHVGQAEVDAVANVRPREEMVEALLTLQERGLRVGVVSNNTGRGIRAALGAVGIDPDSLVTVVSREDVQRPKPAPDAVERAVDELREDGWEPGDTGRLVYVGDAPSDVLAVRMAMLEDPPWNLQRPIVVIVGGGLAGTGALAGPDADHIAEDAATARDLLLGRTGGHKTN